MSYATIGIIAILGFIASVLLTSTLIPVLIHKQAGQNIRQEGPSAHLSKAGTPSMGGIAIIVATVLAGAIGKHYSADTLVILAGFLLFGLLGFIDDYLKVVKKNNEGFKVLPKLSLQILFAASIAVYMAYFSGKGTGVYIPFVGTEFDFGFWYIPFITFTIVAMVNAVNLTDGLDGLAGGITAIVCLAMAYIAVGEGSQASAIFYSATLGACLGFLIYNKYPAKIFMGDTGSLALGGGITVAAIVMKMELMLPIIGLVYVIEALSVCIQVGYFKATKGKRFFKMTPIHHHFELSGIKEKNVALMFWVATLVFAIIGIALA